LAWKQEKESLLSGFTASDVLVCIILRYLISCCQATYSCPSVVSNVLIMCNFAGVCHRVFLSLGSSCSHKSATFCSGARSVLSVNLLQPTGHVMHHHQFNNQQLYALPTLYLYVLYLSENKQRLVPLTA
jgi:hypothetical protein